MSAVYIYGNKARLRKIGPFLVLFGKMQLLMICSAALIVNRLFLSYAAELFTYSWWFLPQTRELIDWRWPLPFVHSVMMVFSAQLVRAGGSISLPTPFHSICPLPPQRELRGPLQPLLPSNTSEILLPVLKSIAPILRWNS